MLRASLGWFLVATALVACGGSDDDGAVPGDGAATDAAPDGGATDGAAPDAPVDGAGGCGTMVAPVAMITGTEGLAIADDGTIYYSQGGGRVGRWQPGGSPQNAWVSLAGATTVWGMGLAPGGILYVATPGGGGTIWRIDTGAATPSATAYLTGAGSANGLTIGPDGAVYYSDFVGTGHVWRVAAMSTRTQVTTAAINRPNGVVFDGDGKLLVASYATGMVHRLTLGADHVETGRETKSPAMAGNPDGIARDAMGRYYLTDNNGGKVLRYDAQWANREELLTGVGAAANLAWGRGPLTCTDVYVTSSGALRRIAAGAIGWP